MIITRTIIPGISFQFELTKNEIEEAYRIQERHYRCSDAYNHFIEMYGSGNEGFEDDFLKRYGFDIKDIADKDSENYLLDDFLAEFEKRLDCNIAEDDTWKNAIEAVMNERFPYKKEEPIMGGAF